LLLIVIPIMCATHCCFTNVYRDADPHFGLWQAKDMQIHMEDVLSNLPLEILQVINTVHTVSSFYQRACSHMA
jgi:hypothetical protein